MLIIMDGFGLSEKKEYNAVAQANLKVLPKLMQIYPHSYLEASAEAVVNIITVPYGANRLLRRDIVYSSGHGYISFFYCQNSGKCRESQSERSAKGRNSLTKVNK